MSWTQTDENIINLLIKFGHSLSGRIISTPHSEHILAYTFSLIQHLDPETEVTPDVTYSSES